MSYMRCLDQCINAAALERQRRWSTKAFGPSPRVKGILEHIAKEMTEVRDNPTDLYEWVDIVILALDGAWRAGHEPQTIIDAIHAKQAKNEAREWPDWREASEDEAIEHVRTPALPPSIVVDGKVVELEKVVTRYVFTDNEGGQPDDDDGFVQYVIEQLLAAAREVAE